MSNTKMAAAKWFCDIDPHLPNGMSECMTYGMTWGCEPECPVYQRGECEIQDMNRELFEEE